MRKLVLALLTSSFITPALAADLPVPYKAQPLVSPFSIVGGNGFFVGAGTSAAVAQSNVSGNVINIPGVGGATNAAGGTIGGDAGYIWGRCGSILGWCQVEVDIKYMNITGNTAVGSINYRWGVTEEFDVGIDAIQTVLSALPSIPNIFPILANPSGALPANIAVGTPLGYVGAKVGEFNINGNVGQASGQTWVVTPGVTTGFRWPVLGSNGKPNGGSLKVYGDVLFANKGVTLSNVFGTAGGPMLVQNANASLNTMYVVGLNYDLGF